MMDPFTVLASLGLGVASNGVYDFLKARLTGPNPPTAEQLTAELQNVINMSGVKVQAGTVIEALARQGVISITNSQLHAPQSITIGAQGGQAWFGDNSLSTTDNTAIHAQGVGTGIRTTGNARVVQHPDGTITFEV